MAVTYAYGTYPPLIMTANCRTRASASGLSLRMTNPCDNGRAACEDDPWVEPAPRSGTAAKVPLCWLSTLPGAWRVSS